MLTTVLTTTKELLDSIIFEVSHRIGIDAKTVVGPGQQVWWSWINEDDGWNSGVRLGLFSHYSGFQLIVFDFVGNSENPVLVESKVDHCLFPSGKLGEESNWEEILIRAWNRVQKFYKGMRFESYYSELKGRTGGREHITSSTFGKVESSPIVYASYPYLGEQ